MRLLTPLTSALGALACHHAPAQPAPRDTPATHLHAAASAAPATHPPTLSAPTPAQLHDHLASLPGQGPPVATIITSLGTLHCVLTPELAPLATASFVLLATGHTPWLDQETGAIAQRPFYDHTLIDRALPDLFVQAGARPGTRHHEPGWSLPREQGLAHDRAGLLLLARRHNGQQSAQLILTATALPALAHSHTAFGACQPTALIQQMTRLPTDASDRPLSPPTIHTITITRSSPL
jgi:peptidyl-prolyl cis-trans isomerase A (cyclophilin A)